MNSNQVAVKQVCGAVTLEFYSYNTTDKKGREVGVVFSVYPVTNELSAEGRTMVSPDQMGEGFEIWSKSTRNGEGFGGAYTRTWFRTMEEARNYISRRVEDGRKRAQKVQA